MGDKEPHPADLHTFLRDFSAATAVGRDTSVLIDAPYADHSTTIADYTKGQSLVETLLSCGRERVLVTDWKSATEEMKDFDIDTYLAEMNVVIDTVRGRVHLIGVCQGDQCAEARQGRYGAADARGRCAKRIPDDRR